MLQKIEEIQNSVKPVLIKGKGSMFVVDPKKVSFYEFGDNWMALHTDSGESLHLILDAEGHLICDNVFK